MMIFQMMIILKHPQSIRALTRLRTHCGSGNPRNPFFQGVSQTLLSSHNKESSTKRAEIRNFRQKLSAAPNGAKQYEKNPEFSASTERPPAQTSPTGDFDFLSIEENTIIIIHRGKCLKKFSFSTRKDAAPKARKLGPLENWKQFRLFCRILASHNAL